MPLLVHQKRFAVGAHILFAVHAFFAPHAVTFDYLFIRVGKQVERQLVFRDKFLMRFFIVGRNAENLYSLAVKDGVGVAERARLFRTARRIVLWIKIKNYAFALIDRTVLQDFRSGPLS